MQIGNFQELYNASTQNAARIEQTSTILTEETPKRKGTTRYT